MYSWRATYRVRDEQDSSWVCHAHPSAPLINMLALLTATLVVDFFSSSFSFNKRGFVN